MAVLPKDQELEDNKHSLSRGVFPTKMKYSHMSAVQRKLVLFCLMLIIRDMHLLSKNKLNLARNLAICGKLNIFFELEIKYVCLF